MYKKTLGTQSNARGKEDCIWVSQHPGFRNFIPVYFLLYPAFQTLKEVSGNRHIFDPYTFLYAKKKETTHSRRPQIELCKQTVVLHVTADLITARTAISKDFVVTSNKSYYRLKILLAFIQSKLLALKMYNASCSSKGTLYRNL